MAEEQIFRLINYYEDGSIRDLYENDDLEWIYEKWIDEVLERPNCLHQIETTAGEVIWENDTGQAAAIERGEEPEKVWKSDRAKWETKKMQCVPWWKFGYTDFFE
jgi:hypothetical protein